MAVDGQLSPYDGEWASDGGQGTWIKLGFSNSYTLVGARFMQRLAETGQNKKLKLEFSDGSSQEVGAHQKEEFKGTLAVINFKNAYSVGSYIETSV